VVFACCVGGGSLGGSNISPPISIHCHSRATTTQHTTPPVQNCRQPQVGISFFIIKTPNSRALMPNTGIMPPSSVAAESSASSLVNPGSVEFADPAKIWEWLYGVVVRMQLFRAQSLYSNDTLRNTVLLACVKQAQRVLNPSSLRTTNANLHDLTGPRSTTKTTTTTTAATTTTTTALQPCRPRRLCRGRREFT
jgi:hypothetical protein